MMARYPVAACAYRYRGSSLGRPDQQSGERALHEITIGSGCKLLSNNRAIIGEQQDDVDIGDSAH